MLKADVIYHEELIAFDNRLGLSDSIGMRYIATWLEATLLTKSTSSSLGRLLAWVVLG